MNKKEIFKNIETKNINMNEIETLVNEEPKLNNEMLKIFNNYEEFYKKNEKKIFKKISKINFIKIPLLKINNLLK